MRGISFEPIAHKYDSIGDMPVIDWVSGTGFIANFFEPFDRDGIALKSSKGRGKWKGIDPEKIKEIWDNEMNRAIDLGNWYHDQREQEVLACKTLDIGHGDLRVFPSKFASGLKVESDLRLVDGIYPELMVYLESEGICGQADLVEVVDDEVHVYDYKSSKEIPMKSYVNWEGKSNRMYPPISHIDDSKGMHYALQLSLYMYIILRHNPKLRPGKIELHHVKFVKESEDEFGYPIYEQENGHAKVSELVKIPVPYLKKEIEAMIKKFRTIRKK